MRKFIVACLMTIALCACRPAPTATFEAPAAEYINKEGKGTIEGHAFFRDEKGSVVYAAGEHVFLIPVTTYAEQRMAQVFGTAKYVQAKFLPWDQSDAGFRKYMRSTKAESTGTFKFEKVAPGDYFVATTVSWLPENSFIMKGGAIYEKVTLTGKEKDAVKVIVSGK